MKSIERQSPGKPPADQGVETQKDLQHMGRDLAPRKGQDFKTGLNGFIFSMIFPLKEPMSLYYRET